MEVNLSDYDRERLDRPVKRNGGGHQRLLWDLAQTRAGNVQSLTDDQCERVVRHVYNYKKGGYQNRLKPLAEAVLAAKSS